MKNIKQMMKLIIIIGMLIILVISLTGCGNKSQEQIDNEAYEEPIKNMIEGIQNTDVEKYMNAFPEFLNLKIAQKDLDELMNTYIELYGQGIQISYEITNKQEIPNEKLVEMQENIKKYFEHECTIKKGYKLEISQTVKGSKDQNISDKTIDVYEIDGKWYIISF